MGMLVNLIVSLLVGAICGWIAGLIMKSNNGIIGSIICGVVGACLLIAIFRLIRK